MPFETLSVAFDQAVAEIQINRPKKLNALNHETMVELHQAFDQALEDQVVRVVILRGAGDKAFVAGADIEEIQKLNPNQALEFSQLGQTLMRKVETSEKPVIGAIDGYALGGGCELALACTLRIASEQARFGLPEISLGLLPGFGGTQRLSRLVGRGRAMELTLTGRQIKAAEALEIGLVSRLVKAEELDSVCQQLAEQLASAAPLAMRSIIQAINCGTEASLERGLEYESQLFAILTSTDDAREGTTAFLERRAAKFIGQ